ncbi:alpha/beta hydrolase [Bifidobacterium bifidum]|nr:alpha/beta hydrolase [Bifidobacterium bifidum]
MISGTRGARLCMYPGMAHAICDREIDDIRDFLR